MENNCIAIVLAAGEGKRMKSPLPKTVHRLAGKALCEWVVDSAEQATGVKPVLVIGADTGKFTAIFSDRVFYAVQQKPLGSGHAVLAAKEHLTGDGYAIIIAGDMPLIRARTLKALADRAVAEKLAVCILSTVSENPSGYGRILRNNNGVARIVEDKDATDEQKKIQEINLSVYCFHIPPLLKALYSLNNENAQKEYYLTDCIEYLSKEGHSIETVALQDGSEGLGVNDRVQLADAAKLLRKRINNQIMLSGATLIDPDNTYIDANVTVGRDAVIYPNVTLEGLTVIKENAVIYPGSRICDSTIGRGTTVQNSVILQSKIGDNTTIGPYAYLRPKSVIGNGCRVGDFVEIKNARLKDGAKVSHLSYIGDGEIGEKSNIGCGVVFVNYDGKKKSDTVIGKNAFIGCNVNLVAPVTVGDGAYVAAGSTVTSDVEPDSLCVARCRQRTISGWAKRRREE
ncbi:MAG: bifunctional UDP-N-acetylglucosamine diphosphorylase/glucosamine-1-phosphate N-acetyltransferase GlmU [Christensenellales bacterium]